MFVYIYKCCPSNYVGDSRSIAKLLGTGFPQIINHLVLSKKNKLLMKLVTETMTV